MNAKKLRPLEVGEVIKCLTSIVEWNTHDRYYLVLLIFYYFRYLDILVSSIL